ncbi:MAG: ribonuclease P protein component [candidate division NC10 bacterium]|nr:ribonuclease P protein component [candidate division NC10 bacterium]MBI3003128.1 ribonuclease P protein component [candidate division NC10 bacterium]
MRPGGREQRRFPRTARLLKASDYTRVLKAGRRVSTGPFTLHLARAGAHAARLGLVIGRRAGAAVVRNRVKRSLREQFRQHRNLFPPGTDLVVVVTRDLTSATAAALRRAAAEALRAAARQPAGGTPHGTSEPPAR